MSPVAMMMYTEPLNDDNETSNSYEDISPKPKPNPSRPRQSRSKSVADLVPERNPRRNRGREDHSVSRRGIRRTLSGDVGPNPTRPSALAPDSNPDASRRGLRRAKSGDVSALGDRAPDSNPDASRRGARRSRSKSSDRASPSEAPVRRTSVSSSVGSISDEDHASTGDTKHDPDAPRRGVRRRKSGDVTRDEPVERRLSGEHVKVASEDHKRGVRRSKSGDAALAADSLRRPSEGASSQRRLSGDANSTRRQSESASQRRPSESASQRRPSEGASQRRPSEGASQQRPSDGGHGPMRASEHRRSSNQTSRSEHLSRVSRPRDSRANNSMHGGSRRSSRTLPRGSLDSPRQQGKLLEDMTDSETDSEDRGPRRSARSKLPSNNSPMMTQSKSPYMPGYETNNFHESPGMSGNSESLCATSPNKRNSAPEVRARMTAHSKSPVRVARNSAHAKSPGREEGINAHSKSPTRRGSQPRNSYTQQDQSTGFGMDDDRSAMQPAPQPMPPATPPEKLEMPSDPDLFIVTREGIFSSDNVPPAAKQRHLANNVKKNNSMIPNQLPATIVKAAVKNSRMKKTSRMPAAKPSSSFRLTAEWDETKHTMTENFFGSKTNPSKSNAQENFVVKRNDPKDAHTADSFFDDKFDDPLKVNEFDDPLKANEFPLDDNQDDPFGFIDSNPDNNDPLTTQSHHSAFGSAKQQNHASGKRGGRRSRGGGEGDRAPAANRNSRTNRPLTKAKSSSDLDVKPRSPRSRSTDRGIESRSSRARSTERDPRGARSRSSERDDMGKNGRAMSFRTPAGPR